ncbi:hypothetical protein D3C71_1773340 [compost metagenome]
MHHAHRKVGFLLGEGGKIGFCPDDGEGTLIDGVAIPDVIILRHFYPCSNAAETRAAPSRVRQERADSPASLFLRTRSASRSSADFIPFSSV